MFATQMSQPPPVVFMTGPEATGKTALVQAYMRDAMPSFVHLHVTTVKHSVRLLLERILRGLGADKTQCPDGLPQFISHLRQFCLAVHHHLVASRTEIIA
jgi:hypothetical protein